MCRACNRVQQSLQPCAAGGRQSPHAKVRGAVLTLGRYEGVGAQSGHGRPARAAQDPAPLAAPLVALYGRQLLEALRGLHDLGLPGV